MADFFGEETDPFAPMTGVKKATSTPLHQPGTAGAAGAPTTTTSGYIGPKTASGGATGRFVASAAYNDPNAAKNFDPSKVSFGASGAYNYASPAGRAQYDVMHDQGNTDDLFINSTELLNQLGQKAGIANAGDATGGGGALSVSGFKSPLDINPVQPVVNPTSGLGTTAGGATTALTPGTAAVAGLVGGAGPGDALSQAMSGIGGGGQSFDASGADRGGMGAGLGPYGATLQAAQGQADAARALGADVLSGRVAAGGAGAGAQQDVLDQVMGFARGPEGPSKAQLLLQQASQGNMADVLSAARSGRARDAGSQARAMNVAQGEIAGLGVDAARNAAMLRAQEAQDFRNQQLSALGLGGDITGAMRGAGIQERGQSLDFAQGQQQIGAGIGADVLKAIPALEGIRHEDQFELTPQQKLLAAQLGGPREPTTADYVTGLLGDALPVLGTILKPKDE